MIRRYKKRSDTLDLSIPEPTAHIISLAVNVCLILPSASSRAPGSDLKSAPVDCLFRDLPALLLTSCQETKSDPPPFSPKITDGFTNMAAVHATGPALTCARKLAVFFLPPLSNPGLKNVDIWKNAAASRNPLATSHLHFKHAWVVVFSSHPRGIGLP